MPPTAAASHTSKTSALRWRQREGAYTATEQCDLGDQHFGSQPFLSTDAMRVLGRHDKVSLHGGSIWTPCPDSGRFRLSFRPPWTVRDARTPRNLRHMRRRRVAAWARCAVISAQFSHALRHLPCAYAGPVCPSDTTEHQTGPVHHAHTPTGCQS